MKELNLYISLGHFANSPSVFLGFHASSTYTDIIYAIRRFTREAGYLCRKRQTIIIR